MKKIYQIIGLMSGSSLDGLDLACVEFEVDTADDNQLAWRLLAGQTLPFTPEWIEILQKLPQANALDFCRTHAQLGHYFGKLTKQFLEAHLHQYPTQHQF